MKRRWVNKDVEVQPLKQLPITRQKPHARYRLVSEKTSFDLILTQQLFPHKSSHFHYHPTKEILIVLKGKLVVETPQGRKHAPPKSMIWIPPNVIHRVENVGDANTLSVILIEKGYREKDVTYVEKRGRRWYQVRSKK